ncbi:hypothetical protein RDI58_005310 [Solanum bulbocastanum]|uniref:Uncharacterized protein n=1 Tax=Solanum bulbocastanum TaxID=147425 RepID=A0AAN8YQU1_SOLBU
MGNMETPARSVDPLVVGCCGHVCSGVAFTVEYASKQISNNGVEIKPTEAAQKPRVHIKGSPYSNNLYTLDCHGYSRGRRCLSRKGGGGIYGTEATSGDTSIRVHSV